MKEVKIYSIGSCNSESGSGLYEVLLEYGEHRKYLTKSIEDTTANRCIILGFIAALEKLKEPCKVEFISTTKVGLSGLRKNKGPNVDLLKQLISLLSERECEYEFNEAIGQGEEINRYIHKFKNTP
ncbi:hypothetical protein NDQ72_08270 [Halomonas sp. KG2]|uniref:RNase H family protein n=1 Tax=Halomonas sp. KG2 TaxID=2951138 RepID=UPI0026494075|nr:RNase H family protein [Halomonas sp. KG2]WKD29923.1 hypothetical protein NDQ72_08270 [Halomonas sp. KG2]